MKPPEVSKFECLNVFSLIETICRKCGQNFRPRMQKFYFQLTCIAQKRPCLLWLKTIVNAIMIIISYFLATERVFNISFLQMSLPHSHGILLFWLCLETRRAGKTDASVARRKDEAFGGCTFQVKTAFFILFNSRISSDLVIVLFHPLICLRKWFCSRIVSLSLVFCMKKRKNVNQNTPFAAFFL